MIQRIQSIFFLVAGLILALLFLEPFSLFRSEERLESPYFNDGAFETTDNQIMIVLYTIAILLVIITLFLYKNRSYQQIAAYLSIIATIMAFSYSMFLFTETGQDYQEVSLGWGIGIPLITIILLWMGVRYVKKDEKLVRSADRLR